MKIETSLQLFLKFSYVKFNHSRFIRYRVVPNTETEGRRDFNGLSAGMKGNFKKCHNYLSVTAGYWK
jgi:hypothetical protein